MKTKPSHEEIKELQKSYFKPVRGKLPSQVYDFPWVYAERKVGSYPKATSRSGKWLIFVTTKNIDVVWKKIRKATKEGKLGDASKVSTMCPTGFDPSMHVICVYTYDYQDETDVTRVRDELQALGILKGTYKSDSDTMSGKYRRTGYKNFGKYKFGYSPRLDEKTLRQAAQAQREGKEITLTNPEGKEVGKL